MPISLWFICGFYKWQHNQNIFITLLIIPEPQLLLIIISSSSSFLFSSFILSHSKLVLYSSQLIFIMFSLSSSLSLSLSLTHTHSLSLSHTHTLSLSLSIALSIACSCSHDLSFSRFSDAVVTAANVCLRTIQKQIHQRKNVP